MWLLGHAAASSSATAAEPEQPDWGDKSSDDEGEQRGAEDDGNDAKKFRASGPQLVKLVHQDYELFHVMTTAPAASQELEKIVALRMDAEQRLNLNRAVEELPWSEVTKLVAEYKAWWRERPEQKAKEAALQARCQQVSNISRTIASNFRVHLYEVFGGDAWLKWFFAVGEVTQEIVDLAQAYLRERTQETEGRSPRAEPHPNPRFSEQTRQRRIGVSEGDIVYTGVQHKVGEAQQARKRAKLLKSRVDRAEKDWLQGRYAGSVREWQQQKEEYEDIGLSGVGAF